tara:strand:+ start:510 stop:818 length:309 start_codon:yes stop_codon:yes gene_type:complete
MANTTFTGPVAALNGFIGGANTNPHTGSNDTQQGGTVAWTVSNASTVTIATGNRAGENLSAVSNTAVLIYVADGFSNAPTYAFSNGTQWLRLSDRAVISTSA